MLTLTLYGCGGGRGLGAMRPPFRSALDRMKETEGFVFTSSQAAMYEWVENAIGAFEEIKPGRKAAGSSLAAGGCSGLQHPRNEGFVRQALYGIRSKRSSVWISGRVQRRQLWPFRHAASDAKKTGMDYYVFAAGHP